MKLCCQSLGLIIKKIYVQELRFRSREKDGVYIIIKISTSFFFICHSLSAYYLEDDTVPEDGGKLTKACLPRVLE